MTSQVMGTSSFTVNGTEYTIHINEDVLRKIDKACGLDKEGETSLATRAGKDLCDFLRIKDLPSAIRVALDMQNDDEFRPILQRGLAPAAGALWVATREFVKRQSLSM